jgi:hypothetical protein
VYGKAQASQSDLSKEARKPGVIASQIAQLKRWVIEKASVETNKILQVTFSPSFSLCWSMGLWWETLEQGRGWA